MAKFHATKSIDILWNGLYFKGPAGTSFTLPDEYYEEFVTEVTHGDAEYIWDIVNENQALEDRISNLEGNQYATVLREYIKNDSVAKPKGAVVYISGSNGTNPIVTYSDADTELASSKTVGLLETALAANEHGYVITEGRLSGLNTSTATAGQTVWLSSTAGGVVYGSPPAEPAHSVYLGVVTKANSSTGEIFVKVQNGYELDELHDVSAGSPSDGDIVQYKSATGLWTKTSLTGAGASITSHAHSQYLADTGDTLTGALNISNTGSLTVFGATSTANTQVSTRVDGDASTRWGVRADGFQAWGDGTASRDTNLYRSAVSTLATDDNLEVGLDLTVGGDLTLGGDIIHAGQLDFISGGAVGASVISSGLYLPPGKTVMFEGTTNDASEVILTAEDATGGDKTITLPNVTGTVALTSQVPPTGSVVMWMTATAPSGWLFLDGSTISYSTYPALAAVFGVGSGTFALPDMRDRFVGGRAATVDGWANSSGTFGPNAAISIAHDHTTNIAHAHADTIAVATHGDHTHSVNPAAVTSSGVSPATTYPMGTSTTNSVGAHTHSVDVAATTSAVESTNLTHTVSGGVTSLGATSVTSSSAGGTLSAKSTLLNFIIKT